MQCDIYTEDDVIAAAERWYDRHLALLTAPVGTPLLILLGLARIHNEAEDACRRALQSTVDQAVRLPHRGVTVLLTQAGVFVVESRIVFEPLDALELEHWLEQNQKQRHAERDERINTYTDGLSWV